MRGFCGGRDFFEKNIVAFRHYGSFSQAKKLRPFPHTPIFKKTFTKRGIVYPHRDSLSRRFLFLCLRGESFLAQYRLCLCLAVSVTPAGASHEGMLVR